MRRILLQIIFVLLVLAGGRAFADSPAVFEFDSPAQRARFEQFTENIRCLVCQNQSLATSHADLAGDLRWEIYRMMFKKGASNEQIVDFLVERYGQFVLYRPPMQPSTYLLWFGPALLLFIGFGTLIIIMRRRHQTLTPALSEGEHRRMAQLLEEED